ncbi:unnamed protein product (mitochondrion) [Plasmodiophora brassicae]|uniref:Uncharacterized protein n=1 Tax=Plasmodiophora brassicae TaxID=37360 RepID=A0A0G4J0J6_PLABS|nr:hypothetical protein PBRA_008186 [Plasmodiophora brassicae]SPR01182.1 unnamed protein product [Plasmodiophora brassicae]
MTNRPVLLVAVYTVGIIPFVMGKATETPDCSAPLASQDYSMPWHIGGVFILAAFSSIGIFTAIFLGTRKTSSPTVARVLQVFKMFGIGVIAATAWFHLLSEAYTQFSNPCLSAEWSGYGVNFVGVFALGASFAVQLIELFATGYGARSAMTPYNNVVYDDSTVHSSDDSRDSSTVQIDKNVRKNRSELALANAMPSGHSAQLGGGGHGHDHASNLSTIMLECSILFHSIIIGVTLGVTSDTAEFQTLLIAICFHQVFEGMALGSLVAAMKNATFCKYLVLGILYPLVTPLGMAIGIGIHSSFNDRSSTVIVVQGIMDSLSAGVLIYNTYVELLSVEINHNASFRTFSWGFKCVNMAAVYLGAAAMAIVGIWA